LDLVLPLQVPQLVALFFVVAFGSSLDVAAIQQDMPEPLDYNSELVTVGELDQNSVLVTAGEFGGRLWLGRRRGFASLKPMGYKWSCSECRIGHLVPLFGRVAVGASHHWNQWDTNGPVRNTE
jgi:hypothetical protein